MQLYLINITLRRYTTSEYVLFMEVESSTQLQNYPLLCETALDIYKVIRNRIVCAYNTWQVSADDYQRPVRGRAACVTQY